MSTLREAIQHARTGGTARLGGKEIRFLTFEEAEPIILEQCPSRAVLHDEQGRIVIQAKDGTRGVQVNSDFYASDGTKIGPIEEGHELVIETFADPAFDTERLGLYDVGVHPAVPLSATDEDIYLPVELDEEGKEKPRALRTDWEIV